MHRCKSTVCSVHGLSLIRAEGGLITDPPDLSRSDQIHSDLIRIRSEFLWYQMAVIGPFFLTKF
jgi:hypothetical protein